MDEKQLQFLFDQYGSKAGFADFAEFKGLMADSSARKVFFDNSNKDLGFKDYGEFESLLGFKKKDGGPALPSSPSLELPSVSTEPPKRLTFTDINSRIESLSKAEKDLRELESAPGFTPGGYSPNYAKVNNDAIAAANKNVAKAKADRDKVFSEYAGEISRPVEQLIESQDYTKFFTPSGNIDYAKAREHFQKVSRQFGGGPALVEHWVANLKMRGQGEIERKEVKPLFEQKLKELGLQKYADQEQYANSVYEGAFQKNKSQIDLLIQDRDQRVNGLLDQSKTKVDALTADFNQKAEGLNEMIKAGQIDEQSAKAQYDALRADYEKNVSGINSAYQSEVGKINRQVKQKYGRINQELETISKDKDFVMKSIPEADRKLIDKAYADARGRYLKEKEDATRVIDEASGYGGMFGRVLTSGFLTTMASIGDALSMGGHSNKLVDWMQNKRTSAEEMKTAEYSWSKDPLKRAITSSGQSLGASAPLLVPSIGLMAATGGSATGVVGSALLSYYGENKQNAGQVYRDVLEQTGDVALARDKGREYFEKTAKTMPLYFLGSLGDKVLYLGKGLKKAVAGFGLELAEEVPVEYIQSHAEAVTSQGYKGSLAQYIKENPELMLDIAVGTGVQAGAMKTVAAAFSKVSAVAPAPQTQTLADAIMTQGREFAARLVQTQFDQGLINEQKRDELFQSIGTIEANLAKLDELGVRGDAAKLHMALSQEMAELQANRKAEKDESVQAVLDSKINDLKTQMTGVLTGQTEYIVFGMPGDVNSKTMLTSQYNALSQQEKDDTIRSAKSVTVINNPQLNQQLQDQKQALGNPEGTPEGAYETDATVQSQVEQQAGPAEGGVQERPGVDGGQQEVGQGAGQQGQAPVTQPDTGDRVLGGQAEVDLAGELRGELRQDFQPIIDRAAQSLQDFNIESEVLDEEEFFRRNPNASRDTEGSFMAVDKTGKILFNRQAMERVDPGVVIWHEFTHPVMNVIRNTNKPLYDRMVTGLKQLAQKSPELQAAIDWAQGYRKQMEGESEAFVEAVVDDESVVDAIARIAADPNIMASLPTSFKQTLIDFINQIAKALGIKARVTNTASADFRRTANEIATRLKSGQSMTGVVGAESVGEIENNIARDSGAIETGATVYAGQLRVGESIENTYRESVNLPVRSLESLLAEYGDNVIVVNSDPTGLGTVTLPGGERVSVDGGIGYMALEENISAGVGFAASNDGRVSSFNRIARELQAAGKLKNGKVLVLVMVQKPDSILGNNYTPLYVADALTKIPQSEASRSELVDMLVEPLRSAQMIGMFYSESAPKKGATPDDIEATKAKNEKAKAKGIEKVKKIISEISSVDPRTAHDEMARIFGELSFVQAQKYFETILGGYTNKTTNYTKKISALLYKHAQADQKDLFRRLGEKSLVDAMISNPSDWGYAVAAFVHDVSKQNQKLGGIKHNLFNAKFQGDERFILDRAYRVNDIMVEFNAEQLAKVDRGEKKGAVLAEQQTSQSMYPSGRVSLEGARTMEFPSLTQMGGRYQQSIGGRKMSAAPDYKQRSNVASDNLVKIFQRNNTPLTKEEAIAIVDDLKDWTDWYDGLATYVEGIFGEYAQDVLSLLPLASQANNSAGTVSLAISNAERVYKGESPKGVAEYYGYVSKFLQGMGIESDKMSNFLRAISGNPDAIAVDMHVWSIIKGTDPNKKNVNPKDKAQFDAAKDFVNSVSEAMGIEPRGVQAALWAGNILRTGGKPDSYEQYFADHVNNKGLSERIESWRNNGYQPFTPARKQRQEATGVQLSIGNRQAIIDKAKADGTYLKAPNGQPTNLSKDQWTTVRTPEFKNWFGDWENDPANASKVVDENGEPMVVYHGTRQAGFDTFSNGKKNSNAPAGSHFFTTDKNVARTYSGTLKLVTEFDNELLDESAGIYEAFLSMKNPEETDFMGADWDGFLYGKFGVYNEETGDTEIFDTKDEAENYAEENGIDIDDIRENPYIGNSTDSVVRNAMKYNLDGSIIYNVVDTGSRYQYEEASDVYVVFSPNQIKSATSNVGTFSTEDARIQFSAGPRAESRVEFKLVAFVLRKKAEGYTDQQIAVAINSALPSMAPQDIARLIQDPQQYLVDSFPGFTAAQHSNLYERAKIANIFRSAPQRNIHPFFRSLRVDPDVVKQYYERTKTKREMANAWAKSLFNKNIKPSRGLENWMIQVKEFAKGAMNLEVANAKKTIDQLESTARKIGFDNWELFREAMSDAGMVAGTSQLALPSPIPASITRLPLEIQPYVTMMRDQIDGLTSRLIGLGYVTPEQAITLQNNIGEYVNRAYRLFSESGYQPDPKIRNAAIDFLTNQEYQRLAQEFYDKNAGPGAPPLVSSRTIGETRQEFLPGGLANIPYAQLMEQAAKNAAVQVNRILNKKENPYFGDAKVESRSIGVLKQRQDIPVEIRRLMGEYTDPGVVFMMTVVKQSALLASSQYLKDLRTRGMGTVFFEANDPNIPPTHSHKMASEGSSVLEPLNGLYTTPEIAEALNYIEPTYNMGWQIWMKMVGMVRMGKTVLSPVTQIINFIGNFGFAVMNGLIFTKDGRPFGAAMGEAWRYARGQYKTKQDFNEVTKKAIKLGIVGQSVDANSISEAFSSGDLFDVALDVALTGDGIFKTIKKSRIRPIAFFENLYRMGDDFWKIYAYISEREAYSSAKYKKKYADLTPEEQDIVDAQASERVKNTWPTFSRMFPIVRTLNKTIPLLGDFTGFQGESIRTPINTVLLALEDLKDPDLQASGARRLAAITAYIGIQTAVTAAIPIMLGYGAKGLIGKLINDDDEEEKKWALDEACPPHMYHHDKVAVPSEKSPHILTVISMNANNPINWTQLAVNAYFDGTSDMSAGALAAVFEIGSRFLGLGMTTEAVFDVQYNTKSQNGKPIYIGGKASEGGDDDGTKFMKGLDYVWNKLQPSAVKLYDRWSTTNNPGMEGAAAFGFRTYEIDLHKSFSVHLSRASKTLTDIDGELKNVTMFDKKATEEMKKEAIDEANEKKMAVVQNLNRLYRAYIKLGADPKVMRQTVAKKSAVKLTGMDDKTKAGILNGDIKPNFY